MSPSASRSPDLTAERLGRIRACSREHHDELVTTETSSVGALGQRTQQDVGDLAQERVTELVPGAVVDLLEVVAVDDEDAQRYALLLRPGQGALHSFLEAATVEDAGERIGGRAQSLASESERRIERRRDMSGKHGGRVEDDRIHVTGVAIDPYQRAELARIRAQRKPDDRPRASGLAVGREIEDLADDARVGLGTCDFELDG